MKRLPAKMLASGFYDRMAELKAAIFEARFQRMQKELQACEELQWRQTVALVNLALCFHCSP
jgi:hypothetical protein